MIPFLHHHHKDADAVAYVRRVTNELQFYALALANYQATPPKDTSADQDAMYITRGETDIAVARQALKAYEHHEAPKAMVDYTVKQLERDMEDEPWNDVRPTA